MNADDFFPHEETQAANDHKRTQCQKYHGVGLEQRQTTARFHAPKNIKSGIAKDEVMGIVGKYNNGNQNPSSIKSIEVCTAVMKEFETLAANKPATTKKTTKGESK